MAILVTGGLGFIGSHTVSLIENNYEVVIVDNLSNIKEDVLERLKQIANKNIPFYKKDVTDAEKVNNSTGVCEYIHVVDLAEGHVAAIKHGKQGVNAFNLGTGKGTSVLELIHTFEHVNNVKVPYKIVERLSGDIAYCYADANKAYKNLKWVTKLDLAEMYLDAWKYENINKSSLIEFKFKEAV